MNLDYCLKCVLVLSHDFGCWISMLLQKSLASQKGKRLRRWTTWKYDVTTSCHELCVCLHPWNIWEWNEWSNASFQTLRSYSFLRNTFFFKLSRRCMYLSFFLSIHELLMAFIKKMFPMKAQDPLNYCLTGSGKVSKFSFFFPLSLLLHSSSSDHSSAVQNR